MNRLILRLFFFILTLCLPHTVFAELNIVATIKPLYGLVTNVSGNKNNIKLLISETSSPHHYQMKPSDIKMLENADVIFAIDDKFEVFLSGYLSKHQLKATIVRMSESKDLRFLKARNRQDILEGVHKKHCGCKHGNKDLHLWADIHNAKQIVSKIEETLLTLDPKDAQYYKNNANKTLTRLTALDNELASQLASVNDRRFIVFHDGYQYFEKKYNLSNVGTIAVGNNTSYGAKTMSHIRNVIKEKQVKCIFAEPQFSSDAVRNIAKSSGIKYNYLDIEWGASYSGLKPEEYYFVMMKQNANNLVECLS